MCCCNAIYRFRVARVHVHGNSVSSSLSKRCLSFITFEQAKCGIKNSSEFQKKNTGTWGGRAHAICACVWEEREMSAGGVKGEPLGCVVEKNKSSVYGFSSGYCKWNAFWMGFESWKGSMLSTTTPFSSSSPSPSSSSASSSSSL